MKRLYVFILLQLVCLGWIRATKVSFLESTVAERSETEELVDDFGSASKWAVRRKRRHIGPLEGQIRGSLGWQPIQHKVLKASHVKTTKQRSITEEQRERIRKRKREKYASMDKDDKEKLIRKMSDQQKQRIANLSVEERKAFTRKQNEANRRRYHQKVAIKQLIRHRTMGEEEQP